MLENERKRWVLLPNKVRPSLSVLWPNLGSTSPCTGENLQKTTSYCLLEMLQNTQKVKENLCFYTEIFCIQISANKIVEVTYSKC
jgi:hypothetical protein